MARIKSILGMDQTKDGLYPIVIRVSWKNSRKLYYTGYYTVKDHWIAATGRVSKKHRDYSLINATLTTLESRAKSRIAEAMVTGDNLNPEILFQEKKPVMFGAYMDSLKEHYTKTGQLIMVRKIERLIKEITECFGRDMAVGELGQPEMRKLQQYQVHALKNSNSTVQRKFMLMRSFFRRLINDKLYKGDNPFDSVSISATPVKKEKLTFEEIEKLENLSLEDDLNHTRNMFLFSYYCRGVRFQDVVSLKGKHIYEGRIHFVASKTEKHMSVRIHEKLQQILDQYPTEDDQFVFPYMVDGLTGLDYIRKMDSINTIVNRNLKVIALVAGIKKKLTFHIARHSFAFHLKKKTGSEATVKDALQHSSAHTTRRYLESLEDDFLDDAVEKLYKK